MRRKARRSRERDLAALLEECRGAKDRAYGERNRVIALACRMALRLGLSAGVCEDPDEDDPEWKNVAFIELPTGQVSWHIPKSEMRLFRFLGRHDRAWDGHDNDEKYRRVEKWVRR